MSQYEELMFYYNGISQSIHEERRKTSYEDDIAYSYAYRDVPVVDRNKFNPYEYKILAWYEKGSYLAVKINYPSAKHYEGNKVLIYDGVHIEELRSLKAIDPHFLENKDRPTPIARFEPTYEGWGMALRFCDMLHKERLEIEY